MQHDWPLVALGDVLSLDIDAVPVDSTTTYDFAGVYSFGRGLFYRGETRGSATTYRVFHRLHHNQFVMSQPKGWEGALARVTKEFDGRFLSPVFPTFSANAERLDIRFLEFYLKQAKIWHTLERMSKGIGARRNSVYPDMLFSLSIPLPPLPEQQRIVARIERLAAKIEEARGLRDVVAGNLGRLVVLMSHRNDLSEIEKRSLGWRWVNLGQIMREASSPVKVDATQSYPNLGVYSFGRGLFKKEPIRGTQTSSITLHQVRVGQFIYSRLFAFEGAYGMVGEQFNGFYVSGEFPTFDCDAAEVIPEFLRAYFRSPQVWMELAVRSKGVGHRRQRIHVETILSHRLMLPPLEWQARIKETQAIADRLKALQTRTANDLDALLPAILDRAFRGEL